MEQNSNPQVGCSYETEYALRQSIHFKTGEIIKLEYRNAKQYREIEELNRQMKILLETPDVSDVDPSLPKPELFGYLKTLLIDLSRKEGNAPIHPEYINVKYVEAACRHCFPVLFDKYALLDQDDSNQSKIELAEDILHKFGLTKTQMYEYENLIQRGEIGIAFIDNRDLDEMTTDELYEMGGSTWSG